MQMNCPWSIMENPMNCGYQSVTRKSGAIKRRPVLVSNTPDTITEAYTEHRDFCKPSAMQQLYVRSRWWDYAKGISTHALHSLRKTYKHQGKASSISIKSMLKQYFPIILNATKQHVCSFRIIFFLPMFECTAKFQDFEPAISTSEIDVGLDNVNLNDDNIHEVASDAWKKKLFLKTKRTYYLFFNPWN